MKEISKQYAKNNNLKNIGKIKDSDMSRIILRMQRLQEAKQIKFYSIDFILFEPEKHIGKIQVSFWK